MLTRIFSIITIPFSYLLINSLIGLVTTFVNNYQNHTHFILGFSISLILSLIFVKANNFFAVFNHEMCHLIWAILSFKRPTQFSVTSSGVGKVGFKGSSNLMITLSPYFFPLYALIFIPLISLGYNSDMMMMGFGAMASWTLVVQIKQSHPRQTDLLSYNLLFSYILVIFFQLLWCCMLLKYLQYGLKSIPTIFIDLWYMSQSLFKSFL